MEYKVESYVVQKGDGFVLAKNKSNIWQIAKVVDGKYSFSGNLNFLSNEYLVMPYGHGQRIFNLETQESIFLSDEVNAIVNNIAVSVSNEKLIDLPSRKDFMPEGCKVYCYDGDYIILQNKNGKYGIFDSKKKILSFPVIYYRVDVNNGFALLQVTKEGIAHLVNLSSGKHLTIFNDSNARFEGNYVVTETEGIIALPSLATAYRDFQSSEIVEITGDYALIINEESRRIVNLKTKKIVYNEPKKAVEYVKIVGDYAIEGVGNKKRIYNLQNGEIALDNKKFGESEFLTINGDKLLSSTFSYKPKSVIYDLQTNEKRRFDAIATLIGKDLVLLTERDLNPEKDRRCSIVDLKDKTYRFEISGIYDPKVIGDYILFYNKNGVVRQIYSIDAKKGWPINGNLVALPLDDGSLKMFGTAVNSGIFAADSLDQYSQTISDDNFDSVIDVGLIAQENEYISTITLDDKVIVINAYSKESHDEKLSDIMQIMPDKKYRISADTDLDTVSGLYEIQRKRKE